MGMEENEERTKLSKLINSLPDDPIEINDDDDDDDEVQRTASPFVHSHNQHDKHDSRGDSREDNGDESDASIPRIERKYDLTMLLSMLESKAGAVRKRMNALHEELLRYEDFIFHIKRIHEKHRASRSNVQSLIEEAHTKLCETDEESKHQDRLIDLNSQFETLESDARDFTDCCDRAVRETHQRFDIFGDGIIDLKPSDFNPLDRIDNIHTRDMHEKLDSLSKDIEHLIKDQKKEAKQLKKTKQQSIEVYGKKGKEKEKEKTDEPRVMQSPFSQHEGRSVAEIVQKYEELPKSPMPKSGRLKIDNCINQEDDDGEDVDIRSPKRPKRESADFVQCSDTPENIVDEVVEKSTQSHEEKDDHDSSSDATVETPGKADKRKTPSKRKSSGRKSKKEDEEQHEALQASSSSRGRKRKEPEVMLMDLSGD